MTWRFPNFFSPLLIGLLFASLFSFQCTSSQNQAIDDDTTHTDSTEDLHIPSEEEQVILDLQKQFYQSIELSLPVAAENWTVASTFGPRVKVSDNSRYDFHRGLDIVGERGDSIFAVADGEIVKVYNVGSSAYPNSGRVVIMEHQLATPFTFYGHAVTRYYSLYMHLDAFGEKAQTVLDTGVPQAVSKGELIAFMGDSGETDLLHLHFEMRLETQCSFDYQTRHPESDCAQYGFDPHINPTDFFVNTAELDVEQVYDLALLRQNDQLLILATAQRPYFNIDGVKVVFYSDSTESQIIDEIFVSYNLRSGFDATTTDLLDTPDLAFGTVVVDPLGANDDTYQIQFHVNLLNYPLAQYIHVELLTTTAEVAEQSLAF